MDNTQTNVGVVDNEQGAAPAIAVDERIEKEIRRRRTFAIISHPDAGKTTLTEKLLLYGGAVNLAGVVRARPAPLPTLWKLKSNAVFLLVPQF